MVIPSQAFVGNDERRCRDLMGGILTGKAEDEEKVQTTN
jgi:hypothetical protein